MGFMDMLKQAKEKEINQDGKQYQFKPGDNGSLTAPAPKRDMELMRPLERKARIIMPASPIPIGSVRG